jgi:hypothetical protein
VLLVLLVPQEQKEIQEHRDPLVLLVLLVLQEQKDPQVPLVLLVSQEHKVPLALILNLLVEMVKSYFIIQYQA